MNTRLRHYVQPGAAAALCGWRPSAELLERLGSGWTGHPGADNCTVCADLWRPHGLSAGSHPSIR